jgi:O-antigen ligase
MLALSVWNEPVFRWHNFGPGVANVRQLGFYGLALSGLAIGMLAGRPRPHVCWPQILMLLGGYYMINWSGGRGAFAAGLTASVVVVAMTQPGRRWDIARVAIACFLAAMPLSMILVPHPLWGIESILGRVVPTADLERYSSGRVEMWMQTAAAVSERPWFGHGQGQFRYQIPAALSLNNHPHNSVLQFAYDWGVIGASALIAALAGSIRTSGLKAGADAPTALPAVGALSGLGVMSLVEGSFYHAYPVMVSLVCLAVLATTRPGVSDRPEHESASPPDPPLA